MADKRISQLVDRGTVVNSDVVPIVVSGAVTTNKATISSIQTFMQGNLDLGVTSVGLSMPSAFIVSSSPVTSSGNISVSGAGTVGQYIRGNGTLADFPSISGGGSSISYYLNGSVSQGTIGGIAYREINKTPILGAGTDFVAIADGYLASFITDAGDPALLEIPAGNWNFETVFSANSNAGSPSFYIELYKVNLAGTATLIASNSATPEPIAFGTTIHSYFSALAVPTTSLLITDRLALRYYVARSGRTITLHTENSHLCQVVTTFTTGLTALNGLTAQVQNLAVGTSGTDFNISSASTTHTFNLPTASASNRGALSSADWTTFNNKTSNVGTVTSVGLSSATSGVFIGTTPITTSGSLSFTIATASGSQNGLLSSTDWTTFNGKQAAGNYVTLDTAQSITGTKTFTNSIILKNSPSLAGLILNSFSPNAFEVGATISGTTYYSSIVFPAGAQSWNLPNASGTLALTSNLSAYLPLAGGTLTGALNGTSASFSGNIQLGTIGAGSSTATPNSINLTSTFSNTAGSNLKLKLFEDTGGNIYGIGVSNGQMDFNVPSGAIYRFYTGAATFSSSVGIGGGTPSIFTPYSVATFGSLSTTNNGITIASTITGSGLIEFADGSGGGSPSYRGYIQYAHTSDSLIFGTAGSNSLTIASTGAATFSSSVLANSSITSTTAFGGTFTASDGTNQVRFGSYYNSIGAGNTYDGVIYTTSASGALYFLTGGSTIAKMLITSGGNVGIGTASPTGNLEIQGANRGIGSDGILQVNSNSSQAIDLGGSISFGGVWQGTSVTEWASVSGRKENSTSGQYGGYLSFGTRPHLGVITERMRITSGGNVGIGTSDLASTRLRIKSTTTGSSNFVLYTEDSSANILFWVRDDGLINTGLRSLSPVNNTTAAAANVWINTTDGTLGRSTSSIKYKKNVEDYNKGLNEVMKLRPVIYEGISEIDSDKIFAGLIAEEVHELGLTEFVQYAEDGTPDALAYSNMVSLLIKAIQELKIEIDSLKNQIK